jgi:hypothetical protein
MAYAVFLDDRRISKWYPHKEQALTHALEHGYVMHGRGMEFRMVEVKSSKQEKEGRIDGLPNR